MTYYEAYIKTQSGESIYLGSYDDEYTVYLLYPQYSDITVVPVDYDE